MGNFRLGEFLWRTDIHSEAWIWAVNPERLSDAFRNAQDGRAHAESCPTAKRHVHSGMKVRSLKRL